jgi:hypothetical protein
VPAYLLPGVRVQIKFTKAKTEFYLMDKDADSKTVFQFLDAQLWVRRVRPNPAIPLAHKAVLSKGGVARYNMTRFELKSFTFSSGSQSLSIDNAVLGPVPKRILFTMIKFKDFLGSIDTNPYFFRHYDLRDFARYVNGKQIPGGCLSLERSHEKKKVMAYRTVFEGSGIHDSNSGLQVTPDMDVNVYFMLLYDLTPDRAASEGHTSHQDNVRIELTFAMALPDAITCLIYLEYDGTVLIDYKRLVTTDYY